MILSPKMQTAAVGQIEISDIPILIGIAEKCRLSYWSHKNFVDELARPDSIMLRFMLPEPRIVGFIVGRIVSGGSDEFPMESEIYNIGVDREFQGLGFGQKLFDAFLEQCRKAQAAQIWLEVRASNEKALAFYERNEFVKYSVRKAFYANPTEDAVIMCREIENTIERQQNRA